MVRPLLAGVSLFACVSLGAPARAQVGEGAGALPALGRLDLAARLEPGVAIASSAGYGYTESVLGAGDAHHRLGGTLAASVMPTSWLAIGGRLDGRYDWHSSAGGVDDGWIGDPRLLVRLGGQLGRWALAGQATLWLPGREAPSVALSAASLDLAGLAAYRPAGAPVVLAATLGLRLDRSARAAEDATEMSDADRLALGLGEGPSLLAGLGASARVARAVDLFGELTWDASLDGSPGLGESPLRLGAGGRWSATRAFALQVYGEVVATGRPALAGASGDLSPIEPRASVVLSAIFHAGGAAEAPAMRAAGPGAGAHAPPLDTPGRAPAAAPTGTVRGRAASSDGAALPGARVRIAIGASPPVEVVAGEQGRFEATGVPVGEGTLRISADGHDQTERPIRVTADVPAEIDVTLPRSLPRGQLRGTVTNVQGAPLEARVVVQPLGQEVRCASDGTFEIDVPPGSYTVEVEAPGHRPQERRVVIEDNGVTILNVDLRARR